MIERRPEQRMERRRGGPGDPAGLEHDWTLWLLLLLHVALEAALLVAGHTLFRLHSTLRLASWQKLAFGFGIAAAFVVFGVRAVRLWRRLRAGTPTNPVRGRQG
jgi:hypothetical protein